MQNRTPVLALLALAAGMAVGLLAWLALPSGPDSELATIDTGPATRSLGEPSTPFGSDTTDDPPEALSAVDTSDSATNASVTTTAASSSDDADTTGGGGTATNNATSNTATSDGDTAASPVDSATLANNESALDSTATSPREDSANITRETPTNQTPTTVSGRESDDTSSPTRQPAVSPTTRPPATQTTAAPSPRQAAPATTAPPRATQPPATTAAPRTVPAPPAAARAGTPTTTAAPRTAQGARGCTENCRTVGFQDLRNESNVVVSNVIISNPGGRCVDLTGSSNITLRNVTIEDCGTNNSVSGGYDNGLILIEDARNITIENSLIRNISAERFGADRNNAIQINSSTDVTIRSNMIRDVHSNIEDKGGDRGNRAIKVTGSSSQLTFDSNLFYNAGRNAIQFSRVRNAEGIQIVDNNIQGRGRWDSDYEDMINFYSSSGTSRSPFVVEGNLFRNGGPSTSGTGIILGDGNPSSGPSEYIIVENNRFIDPGHVGINLAGGNNVTIKDNTIVGTGDVPHRTTVGMTINHYGYSSQCRDHVVTGNRVWMDNQHLGGGTNHVWNPGTCTDNVRLSNNVFGDASLR